MLLHIMRNVSLWVASNGVSLVLNNKRLTGIYLKHAVTKSLCNRLASKSSRIFALSVINSLHDVNRTDRREISADASSSLPLITLGSLLSSMSRHCSLNSFITLNVKCRSDAGKKQKTADFLSHIDSGIARRNWRPSITPKKNTFSALRPRVATQQDDQSQTHTGRTYHLLNYTPSV